MVRWAALLSGFLTIGCQSPLGPMEDQELRTAIARMATEQIPTAQSGESNAPEVLASDASPVLAELQARSAELDRLGPQQADGGPQLDLGPELPGEKSQQVGLSLREAIATSVRNNLQTQNARLQQAVTDAQVAQAEAVFDTVFVAGTQFSRQTTPQVGFSGLPPEFFVNDSQSVSMNAGLQTPLVSGGTLGLSASQMWDKNLPESDYSPSPAWYSALDLTLTQPLLRGVGSDVTEAQIRIARNTDRIAALQLQSTLLTLVADVEAAYWDVVLARQVVVSSQWLVSVGIQVRDVLARRRGFDATLADYADAVATVERRQADLIDAQRTARKSSDRLKLLMNDPGLPVGGDSVVVTSDSPVDAPMACNLRLAAATAVERNPGVAQAVVQIDSASINMTVADNGRLPQLDLTGQIGFNGLDGTLGNSWNDAVDGDFMEYLIGAAFSQPIGNRAAEANYRAARLQRSQAAIGYATAVQKAVFEVRVALRDIAADYRLISQRRAARLAQAENLRALLVLEETLAALTPEFLFLKFRRQDGLALAHIDEIRALTDYNSAIAELQRAMGTGLERNRIDIRIEGGGS